MHHNQHIGGSSTSFLEAIISVYNHKHHNNIGAPHQVYFFHFLILLLLFISSVVGLSFISFQFILFFLHIILYYYVTTHFNNISSASHTLLCTKLNELKSAFYPRTKHSIKLRSFELQISNAFQFNVIIIIIIMVIIKLHVLDRRMLKSSLIK